MADAVVPDNTAVRTALWRALHTEVDAAPPVLADTVGLRLVDPPDGWRDRGDMHPIGTAGFRASIVARARFVEDLVLDAVNGTNDPGRPPVHQYVILGAGLDSFVQRHPDLADRLRVFEIDQPTTQAWKRERLSATGLGVAGWLRFVPVDFEVDDDWWSALLRAGFDADAPAVVASTGVSMYLTKDATGATLRRLAEGLAPGSTVVMSFLLPVELVDEQDRLGLEMSARGAAANGTPFVSFYEPQELVQMARTAGFGEVRHVSGRELAERWFTGRTDGLRPSTGEDLVVATR